jgi:hypothetical protein
LLISDGWVASQARAVALSKASGYAPRADDDFGAFVDWLAGELPLY